MLAFQYISIYRKIPYVFCKWKTANCRLLAANGNGKRKFFLGQQMITVIDDCFFNKRAHLCFLQIFPKESYTIPYMYPEK